MSAFREDWYGLFIDDAGRQMETSAKALRNALTWQLGILTQLALLMKYVNFRLVYCMSELMPISLNI